jgi:hypothetical protein
LRQEQTKANRNVYQAGSSGNERLGAVVYRLILVGDEPRKEIAAEAAHSQSYAIDQRVQGWFVVEIHVLYAVVVENHHCPVSTDTPEQYPLSTFVADKSF